MYSYYDGEKWVENVTGSQLKSLAASGGITPDTLVKTPDGKTVKAKQFPALAFAEPASETLDLVPDAMPVPLPHAEKKLPIIPACIGLLFGVVLASAVFVPLYWSKSAKLNDALEVCETLRFLLKSSDELYSKLTEKSKEEWKRELESFMRYGDD